VRTRSCGSCRRTCGRTCARGARRCSASGPAGTGSAASQASKAVGRLVSPLTCSPAAWSAGRAAQRSLRSAVRGGYYGCLAATKGACDNKTLVRRTLAERVILSAVKDELADPEHVAYVLRRVEEEIAKLRSDLPDALKLKEAELSAEQRRLANFVDFIGEGRGSQALAKALMETERRVETLVDEVDALNRSREKVFQAPPVEWIKDRLENLHEVLQNRTARSAKTLRDLLGPIRLDLVTPDIGRPFYKAVTTLDALALIETTSSAEAGSNSLQRWRRRELNPRPRSRKKWRLRA
jgi:hypothetical protein